MGNKAKKVSHNGGCHCGAVRFVVSAVQRIEITMCNCSMCAAFGYQHLIVPKADFKLLSGKDALTTYTFNTGIAKHTFCKTCGVKSFYTPRSHPDGISVNFRCVDTSNIETVRYVHFDGQNWEENVSSLKSDK